MVLPDLEEMRPNSFVIHNSAIKVALRGEGEIAGNRFTLTTWRRDGLIARLRSRTFMIETLDDAINALPQLPIAAAPGEVLPRPLTAGERLSRFEASNYGWTPVELAGTNALLALHTPVRRRKSRGAADFYRVTREGNKAGITPLHEQEALLLAYAQAHLLPPLALSQADNDYFLPAIELPPTHRSLLTRLATTTKEGWRVEAAALPFVVRLLQTLSIGITGG
jgi:hypothetical protein